MGATAAAIDAAGPPRWREDVHRLLREAADPGRTPSRAKVQRAELFVAVLGASSFTYAEATAPQQLPDWVDAHTRMVEYFGDTSI